MAQWSSGMFLFENWGGGTNWMIPDFAISDYIDYHDPRTSTLPMEGLGGVVADLLLLPPRKLT